MSHPAAHRHARRPDRGPLPVAKSNRMRDRWRCCDESKRYSPDRTGPLPKPLQVKCRIHDQSPFSNDLTQL
jgi:hypothetical protein